MKRILYGSLLIIAFLCIGIFALSVALNGFQEALELSFSVPRNLFCTVTALCDVSGNGETKVVDTQEIWTRIHDRALLDVGKYETRKDWKAERTTWPVTHSMRMRATVSVTMVINLQLVTEEDIVVDDENETITITLPQVQPAECFLSEIEYYDESCLLVCGDLENDLQEKAQESVLDSDELDTALDEAFINGQPAIAAFITPVTDYQVVFVKSTENPPRVESGSCN